MCMKTAVLLGLFAALSCAERVQLRGKDSPVQLPSVSSILNASSHTLGRITSGVKTINTHVTDLMKQHSSELEQQKAEYEEQLRQEQALNTQIEKENQAESQEIWDLEKKSDKSRQKAKQLQKDNAGLRKAIVSVQSHIGAVDKFTTSTLKSTNDEGAEDLKVLKTTHEESDDDHEVEQDTKATDADKSDADADKSDADKSDEDGDAGAQDVKEADSDAVSDKVAAKEQDSDDDSDKQSAGKDSSDDSDSPTALIALRVKRARVQSRDDGASDQETEEDEDESDADTDGNKTAVAAVDETPVAQDTANTKSRQMLKELSREIQQLAEQDEHSRSELTNMFQARFQAGKDEQAKLMEKKQLLNSTRTSLVKLNKRLDVAVKHLEKTNANLKDRLKGVGKYLSQLAKYVEKPAADAEKAIPSLPSDVAAFLQMQQSSVAAAASAKTK